MRESYLYGAVAVVACLYLFCIFAGPAFSSGQSKQGVHWNSYETGMEKIKKSDKKGFLHFYTDWCGYCRKMQAETFADQNVIDSLNSDFVAIKINADDRPDIAKQFGADRFPYNWFVNKDTESIGGQPGFISPEMMTHILSYVASDKYKKMRFDEFVEKREK